MQIVQKKGSTRHTFTFEEDKFNFAYEDKSGWGDRDVEYSDFPRKSSLVIERNDWLRNVGVLGCVMGVIQLGVAFDSAGGSLSGKGFWFLIGLVCLVWHRLSIVKNSVFTTSVGGIFVIQGRGHDRIIQEINARKKAQLLRWYGQLNPENELQAEIDKFKWLAEEEVISGEESQRLIAQAMLAHQHDVGITPNRLN